MDSQQRFSFSKRMHSFKYAFKGGYSLIRSEHNARIHLVFTFGVVALGWFSRLTRLEWSMVFVATALVWISEAFNTAIECLADEISTSHNDRIGKAKDISDFAVLVSAVSAIGIGITVFVPHILGVNILKLL